MSSQIENDPNINSFTAALSKPMLSQRCQELTKLIDESSTKLLHQNYPRIVCGIFGASMPGWMLPCVNPHQLPFEFKTIRDFLAPKGHMFKMIDRLQVENMQYEFLTSTGEISQYVNSTPQHNNSKHFYAPKAAQTAAFRSQLAGPNTYCREQSSHWLSAFEYYFYNFSICINNTSQLPAQIQRQGVCSATAVLLSDDNLYFALLFDYLAYFLPVDGTYPPTNAFLNSPQSSLKHVASSSPASAMLRKSSPKPGSGICVSQNEIWRSDMLVHILIEFWLCQSVTKTTNAKVACPAEPVVRVVRNVVKHLHYFANCHSYSITQMSVNENVMEQFTQSTFAYLQPKLLSFLSHCFETWPLDSTFRIVLETWLSYIQPWRYTQGCSNEDMKLSSNREVANAWYNFIAVNLPFYNKLLHLSITRFLRMDLSTHANSLLLYRVSKIFSQPNLLEMIEDAERLPCFNGNKNMYGYNLGSFLAPMSPSDQSLHYHTSFIVSDDLKGLVKQLLLVCQQALGTIRKRLKDEQQDWNTWILQILGLASISQVHTSGSHHSMVDVKKSEQQLVESTKLLSELFDLDMLDIELIFQRQEVERSDISPVQDCVRDEAGNILLTDRERFEVINNMKKLPVIPKCDPDLQPIKSFENAFMVRLLYRTSCALNTKYGDDFKAWCGRDDVLGRLSRYFLEPSFVLNSSSRMRQIVKTKGNPRLSLRMFANYRVIFYLFVYFLWCKLYGVSAFSTLFYLVLLSCLCFLFEFIVDDIMCVKVSHRS